MCNVRSLEDVIVGLTPERASQWLDMQCDTAYHV